MPNDNRRWRAALAIIAVATLLRLVLAALIPLFPDETYYWEWSRHLAAGYFDHPPMIALLVRAGTLVFGATRLGVRFFPIVAGGLGALAMADTARRLAGERAALFTATAISLVPLAAAGLVLTTPDSPLLASTAFAVWALTNALESPLRSRASLGWWCVTGVALGCAFASKYTSILLPVGAVIGIVTSKDLRARFREPGPYVACVIASLVLLPVLLWNAHHGWISFVFQLQHGLGTPKGSALQREGDLLGGQAGLMSPILFVMMGIAVVHALRARVGARYALACVAAFAFLFFVYSATRRHVEPNWPAPAYIPAVVSLGIWAVTLRSTRSLRAGYWFAGVLSLVVYAQALAPILPLKPNRDPIARAYGFDVLAAFTAANAQRLSDSTHTRTWLGGDRYQDASEIAWNAPGQPTTFAVNLSGRDNQYDLWPSFADVANPGESLVLALDETPGMHTTAQRLAPYFSFVRPGPLVELRRLTGVVTARRLWILGGWRGGWPTAR